MSKWQELVVPWIFLVSKQLKLLWSISLKSHSIQFGGLYNQSLVDVVQIQKKKKLFGVVQIKKLDRLGFFFLYGDLKKNISRFDESFGIPQYAHGVKQRTQDRWLMFKEVISENLEVFKASEMTHWSIFSLKICTRKWASHKGDNFHVWRTRDMWCLRKISQSERR